MSLYLHIERLILDGFPSELSNARLIQQAVESRLTELLTIHGTAPNSHFDSSALQARSGTVRISLDGGAAGTGAQIAQAIHTAVWEPGLERKSTPRQRPNEGSRREFEGDVIHQGSNGR